MNILAVKTDGADTYIGIYSDQKLMGDKTWSSGRDLARDLLTEIIKLLGGHGLELSAVGGIVCYSGPGSFTSLRIGITVANTLAYSNCIPIVSETGDEWTAQATNRLLNGESEKIVLPAYGSEPHITPQKK